MYRLLLVTVVIVTACGRSTPRSAPPTNDAARIECDRFAARAIQVGDAAEAARLTSLASTCYAALDSIAP